MPMDAAKPIPVRTADSVEGRRTKLGEDGVRLCHLQYRLGRVELCPGPGCPFWEAGGVVLEGGCGLERLGLDLEARPDLVPALADVRRKLDQAVTPDDVAEARALFVRLVPAAHDEG
jgi:hypothetical protein